VLKFRGYVINNNRMPYAPGQPLTDADFHPEFEQKGVDMRIGIDMANLSSNRSVDLIALATNDTDCIPAMKHARRSGLQVALITFPGYQPVRNCSPLRFEAKRRLACLNHGERKDQGSISELEENPSI